MPWIKMSKSSEGGSSGLENANIITSTGYRSGNIKAGASCQLTLPTSGKYFVFYDYMGGNMNTYSTWVTDYSISQISGTVSIGENDCLYTSNAAGGYVMCGAFVTSSTDEAVIQCSVSGGITQTCYCKISAMAIKVKQTTTIDDLIKNTYEFSYISNSETGDVSNKYVTSTLDTSKKYILINSTVTGDRNKYFDGNGVIVNIASDNTVYDSVNEKFLISSGLGISSTKHVHGWYGTYGSSGGCFEQTRIINVNSNEGSHHTIVFFGYWSQDLKGRVTNIYIPEDCLA